MIGVYADCDDIAWARKQEMKEELFGSIETFLWDEIHQAALIIELTLFYFLALLFDNFRDKQAEAIYSISSELFFQVLYTHFLINDGSHG